MGVLQSISKSTQKDRLFIASCLSADLQTKELHALHERRLEASAEQLSSLNSKQLSCYIQEIRKEFERRIEEEKSRIFKETQARYDLQLNKKIEQLKVELTISIADSLEKEKEIIVRKCNENFTKAVKTHEEELSKEYDKTRIEECKRLYEKAKEEIIKVKQEGRQVRSLTTYKDHFSKGPIDSSFCLAHYAVAIMVTL